MSTDTVIVGTFDGESTEEELSSHLAGEHDWSGGHEDWDDWYLQRVHDEAHARPVEHGHAHPK
jgi:hypothetical protein